MTSALTNKPWQPGLRQKGLYASFLGGINWDTHRNCFDSLLVIWWEKAREVAPMQHCKKECNNKKNSHVITLFPCSDSHPFLSNPYHVHRIRLPKSLRGLSCCKMASVSKLITETCFPSDMQNM